MSEISASDAIEGALHRRFDEDKREYLGVVTEDAEAVIAALAKRGYAVVPIEPTAAMLGAALDLDDGDPLYETIFQAMARAA